MNWLFLRLSCSCSSASLLWLPLFSWFFTGWSQYTHLPLPPGKHTHSNRQILLIWTSDAWMMAKSMENFEILHLNGIILSHVMKGQVPVDMQRSLLWLAKIFALRLFRITCDLQCQKHLWTLGFSVTSVKIWRLGAFMYVFWLCALIVSREELFFDVLLCDVNFS